MPVTSGTGTTVRVARGVRYRFTDRADGDLAVGERGPGAGSSELELRRGRLAPTPWTWLQQVHGADVVHVDRPGGSAGARADAAVTTVVGATLAVNTADCAGVVLWSDTGLPVIGVAHAGWRGLVAGVLQATVSEMRAAGAGRISWRLGPCISPAAYEFGRDDLAEVVAALGPSVEARTARDTPALDLRAGVRAALARADVTEEGGAAQAVACTALDPGYFSWRARADSGRQAAVIWMGDPT